MILFISIHLRQKRIQVTYQVQVKTWVGEKHAPFLLMEENSSYISQRLYPKYIHDYSSEEEIKYIMIEHLDESHFIEMDNTLREPNYNEVGILISMYLNSRNDPLSLFNLEIINWNFDSAKSI